MTNTTASVRALERGLQIVRFLQARGRASLHEMHLGLGLPKPTLLRLLATLQGAGFAWQSLGDRSYHASQVSAAPRRAAAAHDALAEVAGPVLDGLVSQIHWPSDLSVRRGLHMQLRETSRRRSYFQLRLLEVGFRINLLLSAPGRCWLAYCTEPERTALLARLRKAGDAGYLRLGGDAAVAAMVADVRRRGYAIRDPDWGGHLTAAKSEFDDGLMAIAVPILVDGQVLGCINIVWIARVASTAQIVKQHLSQLQQAASLIAERYGLRLAGASAKSGMCAARSGTASSAPFKSSPKGSKVPARPRANKP